MMNNLKKSRMHPIGIIDSTIKQIRFFWVFLVLAIQEKSIWSFVIIGVGLLLAVAFGLLQYFTTTYELKDGIIIYQHGILNKNVKNINVENIQSLDTSSNLMYQFFNLVSLDINLLNDNLRLRPLKKNIALTMIEALNEKNIIKEEQKEKEAKDQILFLSVKDLIFYGFLRVRVLAAIGLILAFYDKVRDFFGYVFDNKEQLDKYLAEGTKSATADFSTFTIIFVTLIVCITIGSIVVTVVRYYNFTLVKKNNNLLCKYGLFNKKSIVIDLNRVQSVKIIKPLRYRFFSLAKLSVETLSSGVSEDLSLKTTIDLIPLAKSSYVENFVKSNFNLDLDYYATKVGERISQKSRSILYRWSLINNLPISIVLFLILYFADEVTLAMKYRILISCSLYIILVIVSVLKKNYKLKHCALFYDNERFKYIYTKGFVLVNEFINITKVGSINSSTNLLLDRKNLIHLTINSIGTNSDIHLRYFDKNYKHKLEKDFINKEVEHYGKNI